VRIISTTELDINEESYISVPSYRIYPENIPVSLKEEKRWILWCYKQENDKLKKIPVDTSGKSINCNYSKNWNSFEDTIEQYNYGKDLAYNGIGFVLGLPFVGIDFDNCVYTTNGKVVPQVIKYVVDIGSYAEKSVSGKGIHIITKMENETLPEGHNCKNSDGDIGYEIYSHSRYFAFTGNHIEYSPKKVTNNEKAVLKFYYSKIHSESKRKVPKASSVTTNFDKLSDEEIIRRCFKAPNQDKFTKLWYGQWRDFKKKDGTQYYYSQSEADLALCQIIAYYTDDPVQVETIVRKSKLVRKKWDDNRGDLTWIQETINKAIDTGLGKLTNQNKDNKFQFKKKGFTQIPTEFWDRLSAKTDLKLGNKFRILVHLIRETYGWAYNPKRLGKYNFKSISKIAQLLDLKRDIVSKALKDFEENGIISIDRKNKIIEMVIKLN